jgi:hypothetical protein
MVCQEVVFSNAACRIEVEPRPYALHGPTYAAQLYVIDEAAQALRPLAFKDGTRVEVHGSSEALALSSAIALLESRFGGYAENAHGCVEPMVPRRLAEP